MLLITLLEPVQTWQMPIRRRCLLLLRRLRTLCLSSQRREIIRTKVPLLICATRTLSATSRRPYPCTSLRCVTRSIRS